MKKLDIAEIVLDEVVYECNAIAAKIAQRLYNNTIDSLINNSGASELSTLYTEWPDDHEKLVAYIQNIIDSDLLSHEEAIAIMSKVTSLKN